jgi:hypothetical protein
MDVLCTCGHPVRLHANGGQCRAADHDGRCTCQSVDIDEAGE